MNNHDLAGRFTPGNTAAMTHGARSRQVAGGMLPDQAEVVAALAERRLEIESDNGGADQLSRVLRDQVENYVDTGLMLAWLRDNLQRNGVLTGKGRTRAAATLYLQVLDRHVRLAQLIGLERVAKPVPALAEILR